MRWIWVIAAAWLGLGAVEAAQHNEPRAINATSQAASIAPGTVDFERGNASSNARRSSLVQVADAEAPEMGRNTAKAAPVVVGVGLRIHQITVIDQKSENFGIIADLQMEYRDPKLAFSTAECDCDVKLLHVDELVALAKEEGTFWPEFYYFNKQGRIFFDNQLAEIEPDGLVRFFERFTAIFQAPDLDFHQYPFDSQTFLSVSCPSCQKATWCSRNWPAGANWEISLVKKNG